MKVAHDRMVIVSSGWRHHLRCKRQLVMRMTGEHGSTIAYLLANKATRADKATKDRRNSLLEEYSALPFYTAAGHRVIAYLSVVRGLRCQSAL